MAPAIFVCDELLHTTSLLSFTECVTSLNSDYKLFAAVVAVKRGVSGGRLQGELRFHAKILGTAPGLGLTLLLRLLFKSSGLKYLEQTLVPSFIAKFGPTSLLIAWSHCFLRFTSSGKRKKEIFSPVSWSCLSFFLHSGTQQCVGISQPISKEKKGFVDQSYSLQRLIGSFPLLSFKK